MNEKMLLEVRKAWMELAKRGPDHVAELWLTPSGRIIDARNAPSRPSRAAVQIGSYRSDVTLEQLNEDVQWVLDRQEGIYG